MEKNILITGITGFAGSHMADILVTSSTNKIVGLKRPNSQLRNIHHLQDKIELINGDLIDQNSLINVLEISQPSEIYHFGALSWVSPSWSMPSAYMQTNAIGTINLLEAMRITNCNARVLVSCTPEEYGDVPEHLIPITEDTRLSPVNHYAASKVAQDAICQSYFTSYDMQIIRTRAFNHEGPRRDILGANASFAYQIARIERNLQESVIEVGNLSAKRNFTDIKDMVDAYILAMEKGNPGELYLIGSQQIQTIRDCLNQLIELSNYEGEITYEVQESRIRPTELNLLIGDFTKFHELTKWKPKVPFKETLQSILNYWRDFIDKGYY
ncbi:MAG: GDP-mannose 4,6-dehydratase [Bacteroidia bacterium]|nr:GDP-mannose 4,6-dehydratase [Bacteroidia bacterium]